MLFDIDKIRVSTRPKLFRRYEYIGGDQVRDLVEVVGLSRRIREGTVTGVLLENSVYCK